MPGDTQESHALAEGIARTSYGKLLAILSVRLRDVSAAEEALSAAFEQALKSWPGNGIPGNPEGWLVQVARNRGVDRLRRQTVRDRIEPALALLAEEAAETNPDELFTDDRLKLLFVCAHPAIDPAMHTPLMLQSVLGLDAARIGSAFLVSPSAMGQRLVRAKTKIRQAGISFEIPEREHLNERVEAVLAAIYAAYGTGWDGDHGADTGTAGLADEALFLGDLLCSLLPSAPEALGLMALMLYTTSRRDARRSTQGAYIPLDRQDTGRWNRSMISRAERLLIEAAAFDKPERYQLEAAIQSAHVKGRLAGRPNWPAIEMLYARLLELAPSLGAFVSHASALAQMGRHEDALARLEAVAGEAGTYQPYWAVRAYCLRQAGRNAEAGKAYDMAIGLSEDASVKAFLGGEKASLGHAG
ncbi:RNA polymerase sigma factor [Aquisalinus flavus]|uniref:DNA-directed RNA polymerase sigma-70 factor n=1 Tax=Aquisalinus flavus TaxID=1526572 RepID=A0A8J2Y3C9_9PROT|nr:DUF6596 domain-containing protein [Aquisalinus flavus]MBD0427642.1 RNA polymerase subunit sigma-70 [Aquisalinus flavus]UNE47429.1 RNA polymerase subunit sigma-70 [Aquisalinus flavus]GGD02640.1 DNA-directed RNA polymerase sigma-70 factor [Aquisalinus flavus]